MGKTRSFNTAFTLIELLVVISIISLLVSILIPSLTKAKDLAKRTACASTLHSAGIGVQLYGADSNLFPPPQYAPYTSNLVDVNSVYGQDYTGDQHSFITLPYKYGLEKNVPWWNAMKSYLGDNEDAVSCPARTWADDSWLGRNSYHWWGWTRVNVQWRGWWAGRPRGTWNWQKITQNNAYMNYEDDLLMSDICAIYADGTSIQTHDSSDAFSAGGNQLYVGGNVEWVNLEDLIARPAAFSTIFAAFPKSY